MILWKSWLVYTEDSRTAEIDLLLVNLDDFTSHISPYPFKHSILFRIALKSVHTFISSKIHTATKGMFKTHTQICPCHTPTLRRSLQWLPIDLGLCSARSPPTHLPALSWTTHHAIVPWPPCLLPMPPSSFLTINLFAKPTEFPNSAKPILSLANSCWRKTLLLPQTRSGSILYFSLALITVVVLWKYPLPHPDYCLWGRNHVHVHHFVFRT